MGMLRRRYGDEMEIPAEENWFQNLQKELREFYFDDAASAYSRKYLRHNRDHEYMNAEDQELIRQIVRKRVSYSGSYPPDPDPGPDEEDL